MVRIFVFFGEHVCHVGVTALMFYGDKAFLEVFSYCVFSHLYVSEAFSGHVVGP